MLLHIYQNSKTFHAKDYSSLILQQVTRLVIDPLIGRIPLLFVDTGIHFFPILTQTLLIKSFRTFYLHIVVFIRR